MIDIKEWALARWKGRQRDAEMKTGMEAVERLTGSAEPTRANTQGLQPARPLADRPATHKTIRQEFAMAAMQGFCGTVLDAEGQWNDPEVIAYTAVEVADALIAALEQP